MLLNGFHSLLGEVKDDDKLVDSVIADIFCSEFDNPKNRVYTQPTLKKIIRLKKSANEIKADKILNFKVTSKPYATILKKTFISLCGKRMQFVMARAEWKVSRVYSHYSFAA